MKTADGATCSDCGEPLTDLYYGYADCGPHTRDEYEHVDGYKLDATSGMADWDNGPTWHWIASTDLPPVTRFWMTKDRCCGKDDLDDPDERDYCRICKDVMEPAGVLARSTPEEG